MPSCLLPRSDIMVLLHQAVGRPIARRACSRRTTSRRKAGIDFEQALLFPWASPRSYSYMRPESLRSRVSDPKLRVSFHATTSMPTDLHWYITDLQMPSRLKPDSRSSVFLILAIS